METGQKTDANHFLAAAHYGIDDILSDQWSEPTWKLAQMQTSSVANRLRSVARWLDSSAATVLTSLAAEAASAPPYQDRRVVRQQLHAIVTQAEKVVRQEFPGTFQVPDVASYEATGVH